MQNCESMRIRFKGKYSVFVILNELLWKEQLSVFLTPNYYFLANRKAENQRPIASTSALLRNRYIFLFHVLNETICDL